MPVDTLFSKFMINRVQISNRLAVAPLTRVSALHDGTVGPLMKDYYTRFAYGGFGLIITEGLYTDPLYSQGYRNQPGISSREQAAGWTDIVQNVHKMGTKIIAQLMHAGALSQYNRFRPRAAGPSSLVPPGKQMSAYEGKGPFGVAREMTETEIGAAIAGFAQSAQLAKEAGFDGVEIHGANGYLLDQFLTPYMNEREDRYGGSLCQRLTLFSEVISAVRKAVGSGFLVGVRVSQKKVNDFTYFWPEAEQGAEVIFTSLKRFGADYIHTTEPNLLDAAFDGSDSLAKLAKRYSTLPVIANGGADIPELARKSISEGESDIVSLGKAALANQDWPNRVKAGLPLEPFDAAMLAPKANLENARRYVEEKAAAQGTVP